MHDLPSHSTIRRLRDQCNEHRRLWDSLHSRVEPLRTSATVPQVGWAQEDRAPQVQLFEGDRAPQTGWVGEERVPQFELLGDDRILGEDWFGEGGESPFEMI